MAYATVVVQSRLQEMNKSLEEAAMDLGCRPFQVFFLVTLPNIKQALGSAWLLTFTLSLDDVVLSAFLSGPGSSTMPIVIFSRAPGPRSARECGGGADHSGGVDRRDRIKPLHRRAERLRSKQLARAARVNPCPERRWR
jgi:putrescine transport system permease protein